ncbi:unnamed protein product [Caenorhabditis auriculariae]|uniref:Uncharacterized protein n=1 Tax=Caenorhabditis auriculariae TaxID=2777116 RepID=A0A8S1HNE1_9PELO|nr:unnamed protein product [Caenorhabditis auriculariae]
MRQCSHHRTERDVCEFVNVPPRPSILSPQTPYLSLVTFCGRRIDSRHDLPSPCKLTRSLAKPAVNGSYLTINRSIETNRHQTNFDQPLDTLTIMKWNCIEGKIESEAVANGGNAERFFSAEDCCKRPMTAYGDKEAFPIECQSSKCTEEVIYAENARGGGDIHKFLSSVQKSNTITMVGNVTSLSIYDLVEIVHKGPGPAITLQKVDLNRGSFKKLKTIKVDDVSIYCDGTTDLIKIEGKIPQDILEQLHEVENKTLAACKSLTTTQPTVLGAAQGSQNIDAEKDTPLYIACAVIVVLLIVSIVSTIIALKLYFCHKKDRPSASLGASEKGAQKKAETAKETSKETSQEKK